jgi:outer membrane scaffolding protein for murein synthesis (MipA/OmpV family)
MRPALPPLLCLALALTLALTLALVPGFARAQVADQSGAAATTNAAADEAAAQPLWEAGLSAFGARSPAYPGAAQRRADGIVLPYFLYRGRVLRAERGTVGVRAARTERAELDIGFAGSFGSSATGNDARRGMPDIGTLVEFGPRLRWQLGPALGGQLTLSVPLRGAFDVSDGFGYRGLALEPSLSWGRRVAGFSLGTSVGLLVADERLADTFYGVAPAFALPSRPAYAARAGLVATRWSFVLNRRLHRDWAVFGFVRVDSVRGAANRSSPLVDTTTGTAAGLGLVWTFARSERPAER